MKEFFAAFLLTVPPLSAQCSATPVSGGNAVTIRCEAPASQSEGLVRVLNRVVSARLNPDIVLSRLDGLADGASKPISEPRILTAADLDRLTRALAPFKGQKASVGYAAADAEASQLADQLDDLVRRAGWIQPDPVIPGGGSARGDTPGIDMTVGERTRASDALWNGLLAAGLDVVAHINPAAVRDGRISLFVYSRR